MIAPDAETVGEIAQINAQRFGARIAFRDDHRSVSFATFADRVGALCRSLQDLGIGKQDRIAFLSKNRIECLEVYLAAETGAVIVPMNWRLKSAELQYILSDCKPSVLIAEPDYADALSDILKNVPSIQHRFLIGETFKDGWQNYEKDLIAANKDGLGILPKSFSKAPACIIYTSGTTGRPKGVVLTHAALISSFKRIAFEMLQLDTSDITLAVMPLFHVGGMWFHCFPSFAVGAMTLIQSKFSASDVLNAITSHKVTNIHLAPTMVGDLLDQPDTPEASACLSSIFYAASPMPLRTLNKAMSQFPNSDFYQSYGSTEAGPICWLSPEDHELAVQSQEHMLQSCGRPFNDVDVRLSDVLGDGDEKGEIREIEVRSTGTMTGYWQNSQATNEAKDQDWVATGDLGRFDENGYLYIADRKSHMIITGGENVYPIEVENALLALEEIVEAAVIGVPDDRWVERVVACVVTSDGSDLTADEIIRQTKLRLSGYKCPKEVRFLSALPTSSAGKVLKRQLKESYPFDN